MELFTVTFIFSFASFVCVCFPFLRNLKKKKVSMGPTSPRVVTKLTTRKTANSLLWLVLTGARTTSERFSGHPLAQTLSSHRR